MAISIFEGNDIIILFPDGCLFMEVGGVSISISHLIHPGPMIPVVLFLSKSIVKVPLNILESIKVIRVLSLNQKSA